MKQVHRHCFERKDLMKRTRKTKLTWLIFLCLTVRVFAQATGPVFPNPGKPSMSRENQEAMGMEAAGQVFQQMPVLPNNSSETQYVRQLGQKLVSTIPQEYSWPFEFH